MRILAIGDIVGRSGRDALLSQLAGLKAKLAADFVIVNGENAAGGFGLTGAIADEFLAAGVDVLTLGNHAWDQKDMIRHIEKEKRIVRALNFPPTMPGRGGGIYPAASGKKVMVVQVQGRLFMEANDDPFAAMDRLLAANRLTQEADAIIVDIHAEATSEKMAFGHHLDGRVSFVFGTHTHIPTADHQVLPGGTAYQTDLGMTGDYDSVIGMKKQTSLARFLKKLPTERMTPATSEATVCGALVVTDDSTGLAVSIEPVRAGGRLSQA